MAKDKKFRKMENKAEKPAVLFSFDGTVMNTKPAVIATYRHVFEHHGKTANFPRTQQIEMLDSSVSSIMRKYLPGEDQQKCIDEYDSWQRNHLVDLIQPMNGIDDLLKWLRKNGWKTGIVSTRERSSIIELLEKTHIVSYFDAVVSSSQSDDHLAVSDIQLICRLLHVSNAIFIGDNASSLRAAREAGAFTIGYIAESDMTDIIVEESPDFVTGDFDEVHKLLKGSPLWLAYQIYQPEEIEAMKQKAEKKARKEEKKKQKKAGKKSKDKEKKKNKEEASASGKKEKKKKEKHKAKQAGE